MLHSNSLYVGYATLFFSFNRKQHSCQCKNDQNGFDHCVIYDFVVCLFDVFVCMLGFHMYYTPWLCQQLGFMCSKSSKHRLLEVVLKWSLSCFFCVLFGIVYVCINLRRACGCSCVCVCRQVALHVWHMMWFRTLCFVLWVLTCLLELCGLLEWLLVSLFYQNKAVPLFLFFWFGLCELIGCVYLAHHLAHWATQEL